MDTLRLTQQGPVATVCLARPQVHNAFHPTMVAELAAVLDELSGDRSVRVVVLAAEGTSFSAGADLAWMQQSAHDSERENEADALRLARLFHALDTFPKPLVVRVQGPALGGGVGLAACGDIVVASERALFGLTEVRLGIIPAVISPYVVRKIGISNARRYFLTGERFDATVAQQLGLVHLVVPAEQLDEAVEAHVHSVLQGGPGAQREAKALIRLVAQTDPEAVLKETAQRIARLRVTEEAQEGLRAFFDKRKPSWVESTDA